jgi:predicted restriction endonuclease
VLATFEREPELIDVVALHLLERHSAPGLHEEILEAVGLELGTPAATRRRDMGFRAAVLEAYLAECCVCGFSLRLMDGLIGVDDAHIRWHAHRGPDEVSNGLALCAVHHRLFDHGAITVRGPTRAGRGGEIGTRLVRGPRWSSGAVAGRSRVLPEPRAPALSAQGGFQGQT